MSAKISLDEAIEFFYDKRLEFGLYGYKLKLTNNKRTMGSCNPVDKVIKFSRMAVKYSTKEKVKDLILHELAHAITAKRYGLFR